jgi:bilirubin oxidase
LIDFQVISRTGGKNRGVQDYEKVALKDVVWLDTNEEVRVMARYAPWPGLYMFHCHNLIHEDHEMLAAFNVSQVAGLNLNETNLFIDPTDPTYSSKPFTESDFTARTGPFSDAAIQQKINFFANLDAYAHVEEVEDALAEFWDNQGVGSPAPKVRRETIARRDALAGKSYYKEIEA